MQMQSRHRCQLTSSYFPNPVAYPLEVTIHQASASSHTVAKCLITPISGVRACIRLMHPASSAWKQLIASTCQDRQLNIMELVPDAAKPILVMLANEMPCWGGGGEGLEATSARDRSRAAAISSSSECLAPGLGIACITNARPASNGQQQSLA